MPDDRPFTFDRFLEIPRLSGLWLSPDGSRLVTAVGGPAKDGKKIVAALWEIDPRGERPARRLTRSAPGESGCAFQRDGSMLFISSRPDPDRSADEESKDDEEITALWLLPAGPGEARAIAAPSGGVDAVKAARDADVLVIAAAVHPGTADLAADADREKARKKAGVSARLFEAYPIRWWDHYFGPRERHLLTGAAPDPAEGRVETLVDLTPDARTALNEAEFDVTPDGHTVVTGWLVARDLPKLEADIVAIDRATGERRTLTAGDAWYGDVAIAPDGHRLACVRTDPGAPDRAPSATLWLLDLDDGAGRDLTPDLETWPHAPRWAPDASAIFFVAPREGNDAVFRVDIDGGGLTVVAADGSYSDLRPSPDGKRLYALRSAVDDPPRPVVLDARAAEQQPRFLPSPVPDRAELALPATRERVFATAPDGARIGSWLVLPNDASAEQPVPLVLWVHGGPLGAWSGWSWRWNPSLLAARGFAVLMPDPGLSTGYGHEMIRRAWGKWGEVPFGDLMAATDEAVKRPELDEERLAAMGGSYGGYMANWIAGQTDRFKAIVTHASIWDLRGFHGTTDLGIDMEYEFGDPYADESRYLENSPHRGLSAIRTPMLVIHGERDHRVPIGEALRLWTDLRRHGVESKFLYFEDENHWILRPPNSRVWYETVFAFLDQHVRGQEWRRPELV